MQQHVVTKSLKKRAFSSFLIISIGLSVCEIARMAVKTPPGKKLFFVTCSLATIEAGRKVYKKSFLNKELQRTAGIASNKN